MRQVNLIILLLIANTAICQYIPRQDLSLYSPPAPNASALLEYASVPITLHTGTPEVSVPLFTLKGRKIDVPISISYHGSGIKVQDISSSVGLGWALNAGGVITRIVRGLPDEGPNGYFSLDFATSSQNVLDMAQNHIDTEPDIFLYNFNGKTGRLVMNPNKEVVELPEQNFAITRPNFIAADPTWEFIDTDGVKYVFGKTENSRETSNVVLHSQYAPGKPANTPSTTMVDKSYSMISSWYLAEIIYPSATETVTFNYEGGSSIYYENYSQSVQSFIEFTNSSPCSTAEDPYVVDNITKITITSPKYIQTIQTRLGTANFLHVSDRQDIQYAKRLSQLTIKNLDNIEIKKYSFVNGGYFVSDGCSSSDCKRLKLEKVVEITNGANIDIRSFGYDLTNLPSRKSVQYDHWGYYNNNPHPSAIPASKSYVRYSVPNSPISFSGADKSPNLARTQANILTTIVNATGATQQLTYELNEIDDNGSTVATGGLRISKVVENDGSGVNGQIVKDYRYKKISVPTKSSGQRYRKYFYDYYFNSTDWCYEVGLNYGISIAYRFSSSCVDIFDIGGSHMGYSDVQIEYSNGAKEHLFFTSNSDRPDDEPILAIPSGYYGENSADFTDADGPPFIGKADRSFERGLVKEHVFFDNTGKRLKQIKNNYDFYLASNVEAPGAKAMILAISSGTMWARKGVYIHKNRGVRLSETIERVFDPTDGTKGIAKRKTYSYNSKISNLVKSETEYFNNGSEIKVEYKYIQDYEYPLTTYADIASDGIYEWSKKYIVNVPIETVAWHKRSGGAYEVIDATLKVVRRDLATSITKPYQEYELKVNASITDFTQSSVAVSGSYRTFTKDARYRLIHTYDTYNTAGNLTQETPEDGVVRAYTYTADNSLVSSITQMPSGVAHVSAFAHLPLVGLSSSTSPALRNTIYEYDKLNRLKLNKDHDLNIVTRYRYHYKNGSELTADFGVTGNNSPTRNVSFTSTISQETSGTTSYVWDFGDGQISQNAPGQTSHVYATPGLYTVKLSKINPEYGSITTTKQINVSTPITASVSGPGSVDLCTNWNGSVTLTANVSGGCGERTYQWYIMSPTDTQWQLWSTDEFPQFNNCTEGTFSFKYTVTDNCGNTATSGSYGLYYLKSDYECSTCQSN